MRDAFIKALGVIAEDDPDTILITGDLGFSVLDGFAERFPDQFINAGVAEQNMTAIACGMAMEGCTVYTYSIGNFPTLRCLEHLRNDVCYHDANVTAVAIGGGFSYGQLGMSHFATEDLAILRSLPNMQVIAPGSAEEAEQLVPQIHARPGPKYLRIDKSNADFAPGTAFTLGEPTVIGNGDDAVIFAMGGIVREAQEAAESLVRDHGLAVRVVALNMLKPLDPARVAEAAAGTRLVATLEEHSTVNGLGTAIREALADTGHGALPVLKFGIGDRYPSVVGDQMYLRDHFGLSGPHVAKGILQALG